MCQEIRPRAPPQVCTYGFRCKVQTIRKGTMSRACSSLRPWCSSSVVNEEACHTRRLVRVAEWMIVIGKRTYPSQGSNGDVA